MERANKHKDIVYSIGAITNKLLKKLKAFNFHNNASLLNE